MKCVLSVACLSLSLSVLGAETPAVAPDVSSWHGTNLLGLFNAAPKKPDPRIRGTFEECYFRWFRDWGFNFARLPMDYRHFLATNDWTNLKTDGFKKVDEAVAWGRKYGVHVQLCLHRAPGYTITSWNPERGDLRTESEPQAAFMRIWSEFARRYRGIPNSELSFNLVNEPTGFTEEQFVDVFGRTVDAIRKEDPGRFVMLDGNECASRPVAHFYKVPLTGQAFRGYTPHAISHYKAWYIKDQPAVEPTWPFSAGMAKAKGWIYERPEVTLEKFAAPYEAGYPVMIGEFGCYNKLSHETCLAWMEHSLKLWNEKGLGWAVWNVDGAFGFMDSDRTDVDYEDFEGHKLDRKMLDLLRRYAKGVTAANSCGDISIRLKGPIGKRLDLMIENHLAATDIDYITAPFASDNERGNLWRTEFWGKFMHAAEPLQRYSGNEKLRRVIDRGVASILATQRPNGYIGNYPDDLRFPQGRGWDVWGMKYTLMGLIHNYDGARNVKSLDAACRLLDYVIAEIGPEGRRGYPLATTGFCAGQPSLSMLEPVMWLYNRTREKRYLDFADYVVAQMDDPQVGPELIRLALADIPVWCRNDPKVLDKVTWNQARNRLKAYEMMSCYQGLLEYYQVTGRKDCFDAAVKSVLSILKDEINLAGGSCSSEHWFHGAIHQHEPYVHLQETCVTITWMRLLEKLSAITGQPMWADQFEKTFFNAYLGACKPDGSEFAGYTPLSGYRWHGQHHCQMHTDCCNANGPRGFLSFLRAAVRTNGSGVFVDQYASSVITAMLPDGRSFGLDVYTLYPSENWVRLASRSNGRCTLSLRIPAWSEKTVVKLNGKEIGDVKSGDYLTLDREWVEGDKIDMYFDMKVVAHVVDRHVAFTCGPVLLARDSRCGKGALDEVIRDDFKDGQTVGGSLLVRSPTPAIAMGVTVPLQVGSHSENPFAARPSQVLFCDYASAGSEWTSENHYRTWFPLERRPWDAEE